MEDLFATAPGQGTQGTGQPVQPVPVQEAQSVPPVQSVPVQVPSQQPVSVDPVAAVPPIETASSGGSVTEGITFDAILSYVNSVDGISDIHLAGGEYIIFREHGDIAKQQNFPVLTDELMEQLILQSYEGDREKLEAFKKRKDDDYSYMSKEKIPYRVNAFYRLGHMALVMRKINGKAKSLDGLMFEDVAQSIKDNILVRKKGLYLVTGPTGSGKSTSLVAMIELMNMQRQEHIITFEDPVEFIFEPKGCTISQRHVGNDTMNFPNALKAAMREDPDIIFVGEIRDKETADAALSMAETGHFVFSTLHTSSAAQTVNRYISFFPPEIQDSVCDRLASSLAGVQSQMLVHKVGGGRVGVYEFMVNNTAVRNNIKKKEIPQLNNTIDTGASSGMISMRKYAERLLDMGLVTQESVNFIFAETAG